MCACVCAPFHRRKERKERKEENRTICNSLAMLLLALLLRLERGEKCIKKQLKRDLSFFVFDNYFRIESILILIQRSTDIIINECIGEGKK